MYGLKLRYANILLQVMENDRDKLVVILAGYKDRMDVFFESNPGMSSRIAHHLDFAPYKLDELVAIGRAMLDRSAYYLSADAEMAFRDYLTLRMGQPRFANARSVRNELERTRLRHAFRLASEPELSRSKDDLMPYYLPPDYLVPMTLPQQPGEPSGPAPDSRQLARSPPVVLRLLECEPSPTCPLQLRDHP